MKKYVSFIIIVSTLILVSINCKVLNVSSKRVINLQKIDTNILVSIENRKANIFFTKDELLKTIKKEIPEIKDKKLYKYKKFLSLKNSLDTLVKNYKVTLDDSLSIHYSAVLELSSLLLKKGKALVYNKRIKGFEKRIIYKKIDGPLSSKSICYYFYSDGIIFLQDDLSL